MIEDPYKILGVSPDATDEEIKSAYRRLAKKYHPDLNPGDEQAAKKMQQVNAAYEQIKNPQKARPAGPGGNPYGSGYGSPYGSPFGSWQQTQASPLDMAEQMIAFGQYLRALSILSAVQDRSARWYFLSALANDGTGNHVTALEHIRKAVSMEPGNRDYLRVLEAIENGGAAYRQQASGFGGYTFRGSPLASLCLCYCAQLCCCRSRFFCC